MLLWGQIRFWKWALMWSPLQWTQIHHLTLHILWWVLTPTHVSQLSACFHGFPAELKAHPVCRTLTGSQRKARAWPSAAVYLSFICMTSRLLPWSPHWGAGRWKSMEVLLTSKPACKSFGLFKQLRWQGVRSSACLRAQSCLRASADLTGRRSYAHFARLVEYRPIERGSEKLGDPDGLLQV